MTDLKICSTVECHRVTVQGAVFHRMTCFSTGFDGNVSVHGLFNGCTFIRFVKKKKEKRNECQRRGVFRSEVCGNRHGDTLLQCGFDNRKKRLEIMANYL